jgi:lipid II:glycine glycyltransferase (peptidoglycan interpeptide bridge formation enzyme)
LTAKNSPDFNHPPPGWDNRQIKRQAYFLQSGAWGDFQASLGIRPHYLMQENWSCLLLERSTPLGRYLLAPYGPTLDSAEALSDALNSLKAYGQELKADWLSLEPIIAGADSNTLRTGLTKIGAKSASHNRQPDLTRVIDLKPPADAILAQVSQSTRSFIRKNQRQKFISFKTSADPADIEVFIQMLSTVTDRNSVYFFPDAYFIKQAQVLMPAGMMRLELALQNDRPITSAVIHDYGQTGAYTYAASLPEARRTSASALLLWQSMLNAKQRGLQKMDLFGTAPDEAPATHPWHGFSSFKKKFGGTVVAHAGTWDIPLTNRYSLYRSAQKARQILRRH